jgi:hypothetical protein
MQKIGTLLALTALCTLGTACNALTVDVTTDFVSLFDVGSSNTVGASKLDVLQAPFFNPIGLTSTESNLGLGTMTTQFSATPAATGGYTFNPATAPGAPYTPGNFSIVITDEANPAHTVTLAVTGGITGTTNVNRLSPPSGSNSLTYTVTSVGGSTTTGIFNDGQGAIIDSFDFFGTPITLKVRIKQSPPVFGGTPTAIEGRILSVPEPGSIAMLIGMGVSGSAFMLRRRRKA